MSDRITRKDIRRDEFVETLEKGVEYTQGHVKSILTSVGALVALGLVAWGIVAWRGSVRDKANDALAGAMRVWSAPIDAATPKPSDPVTPSFATEEARRARAKELFEALVKDHAGSTAGDVGNLYLAAIAIEQGQAEHARELWQAYLKSHRHDMLAASVQVDLLHLDRSQGKVDQVVAELRRLIDDSDRVVPLDTLLYELATTLTQQGKTDDAHKAWQRLADEFPRSPFASEAQRVVAAAPQRALGGSLQ
jgi:TolA-binding protein